MDRFLALEWANYALDLFLSSDDEEKNYELLSNQLKKEISGIESARKTSIQLKRLWLTEKNGKQDLRSIAKEIINNRTVVNYSIFHLGMAINVFPIFYETCNKIGTLSKSHQYLNRQIIIRRVSETFANPTSIPRIVNRVIQTLVDWRFLLVNEDSLLVKQVNLEDKEISSWFVFSLMKASNCQEMTIPDLLSNPNKMGINLVDIRSHINQSNIIKINRDTFGSEIISVIKVR